MATFPRSIWVWPYARGPYYGDVEVTARREPGVLRTRVGSFRLGNDLPFPEQLRTTNKLGQLAAQYFVVQLNPEDAASGSAEQLRQVIESNGGAVLESIPVSAVIARL
ncbi:MAG TPA: hypothetical protein VJS92_07685, partial [Candidatus Polarisedimenticolaceae bacterium]|nr:hypothetical protein [Candidatus Polarisedimenticolaceae bacterium]